MQDDEAYLSLLQATIASFRYWVPAISDTAKVEERETDGIWQMAVRPFQSGSCPFVLTLTRERRYSLAVDGVAYLDRSVDSLNNFLPMAEAIAEGRVVQRRWSSPNTGVETQVETIIWFGQGKVWQGLSASAADDVADLADGIRRERHFLPYRRK